MNQYCNGVPNVINSQITLSSMLDEKTKSYLSSSERLNSLQADELTAVIIGLLVRAQRFDPDDLRFARMTPESWANFVRAEADHLFNALENAQSNFVEECNKHLETFNGK